MTLLAITALVVILFFVAALHSVGQAERRRADRRQGELPCEFEQRHEERRSGHLGSYLAWAFRTLGARFRG